MKKVCNVFRFINRYKIHIKSMLKELFLEVVGKPYGRYGLILSIQSIKLGQGDPLTGDFPGGIVQI